MRIRTIKPEFWSSLDLAPLSEPALLLAAGLLNYADDEGYFVADKRLIRAALFPLREPSRPIGQCLAELVQIGYLNLSTGSDGRPYGRIVKFVQHQRINRPTPSKLRSLWREAPEAPREEVKPPQPEPPREEARPPEPEQNDSPPDATACPELFSNPGDTAAPDDDSPPGEESPPSDAPSKGAATRWIMDLWNEKAPEGLPRCSVWSSKRHKHARERLKEFPRREDWETAIGRIAESAFLVGQNDRKWRANIDWLLERPNSLAKLLEGTYVGGRIQKPLIVGSYDDYVIPEYTPAAKDTAGTPSHRGPPGEAAPDDLDDLQF